VKTLQKCLIALGLIVFAYNAITIVHELGHAAAAMATGGEVDRIEVSPVSWSYAHFVSDPEPRATSWGGFLAAATIGPLVFFIVWGVKSRFSLWGLMLAMAGLVGSGVYMLVGAIIGIGDSASLMARGISPGILIIIGIGLICAGLPFLLLLGSLLGVGRGHTRCRTTLSVISLPVLYLAVSVVYNIVLRPDEWLLWLASAGGCVVLILPAALLVHGSAGWINGPEVRRRAVPVNWLTAGFSLLLAAGIVVGELWAFPSRAESSSEQASPDLPSAELLYFADSENYAGLDDAFDPAVNGSLFWRINDKPGKLRLSKTHGYCRQITWSKAVNKLIVLTTTGLFAVTAGGTIERIVENRGGWRWATNDDAGRFLILGRRPQSERYFVLAIDLKTKAQAVYECEEDDVRPSGLIFLDDNSAAFALPRTLVTLSFDPGGVWKTRTEPHPLPQSRIRAVFQGKPVFDRIVNGGHGQPRSHLHWNGKMLDMHVVLEMFTWRGELLVRCVRPGVAQGVYRIDAAFSAEQMAPPMSGDGIGSGLCETGLWLAFRDGEIRIYGETVQTVRIELPK